MYLAANVVNFLCLCDDERQREANGAAQPSPGNHNHLLPVHGVANVCEERGEASDHNQPTGEQCSYV